MKTITIGKNQEKRAKVIFMLAKNIRSYSLENGFQGKDCNKIGWDGGWLYNKYLLEIKWKRFNGRLTTDDNIHFHLRFHSNHWIEFEN